MTTVHKPYPEELRRGIVARQEKEILRRATAYFARDVLQDDLPP
jgi:transposase-like protein